MKSKFLQKTTLDMEIERVQNECSLADIDFEFVVDSSGSIRLENWEITMNSIAEYWIQGNDFIQISLFILKALVLWNV